MNITETAGKVIVAGLDGRLDTATSGTVEARLLALLGQGGLIADLAQTHYVSSAGLRVLLKLAKQAKATGTAFVVCGLQPAVREVFEISGFDRVLVVHASRAEALAALG
jgi:anti-anti-sigma factor